MDILHLILNNGYNPYLIRGYGGLGYVPPIVGGSAYYREEDFGDADTSQEIDYSKLEGTDIFYYLMIKDNIENSNVYTDMEDIEDSIKQARNDKLINEFDENILNMQLKEKKEKLALVKRVVPTTQEIEKAEKEVQEYDELSTSIKSKLDELDEEYKNITIPAKIPDYLTKFYEEVIKKKKKLGHFVSTSDEGENFYDVDKIKAFCIENKIKNIKPDNIITYLYATQDFKKFVSPTDAYNDLREQKEKITEMVKKNKRILVDLQKTHNENLEKIENNKTFLMKMGKSAEQASKLQKKELEEIAKLNEEEINALTNKNILLIKDKVANKARLAKYERLYKENNSVAYINTIKKLKGEINEIENNIIKNDNKIKELKNEIEKTEKDYEFTPIDKPLRSEDAQYIKSLLDIREIVNEQLKETNSELYTEFEEKYINNPIFEIDEDSIKKLKYIFTKGGDDALIGYYRNETNLLDKTMKQEDVQNRLYLGSRTEANENFERIISKNNTDESLSPEIKAEVEENRKVILQQITGKTTGNILLSDDYLQYKKDGVMVTMPDASNFAFDAMRKPEKNDNKIGEIVEFKKFTSTTYGLRNMIETREEISGLTLQILKNEIIEDMKLISDLNKEIIGFEELFESEEEQEEDDEYKLLKEKFDDFKDSLKNKIDSLNDIIKVENNNKTGTIKFLLDKARINNEFSHKFREPVGIAIGINKFGEQPVYNPSISPNSYYDVKNLYEQQGTNYKVSFNDNCRVFSIKSKVKKEESQKAVKESIENLYEFEKGNTYDLIFVVGTNDALLKFNYSEYLRKLKSEIKGKTTEEGVLIYSGWNIFRIAPDYYGGTGAEAKSLLIPLHLWEPVDLSELQDFSGKLGSTRKAKTPSKAKSTTSKNKYIDV